MTRLLVAGWTGTPNLGDELLFRALVAMAAERSVELTAVSREPGTTETVHGVAAVGRGWHLPLDDVDGLLFGPGGLLQDETSWLSLPNHLWRVAAARRRGLPVAGIGLGAGPLDTRVGRALVRRSLRSAVGVAVRDESSADLLRHVGLTNVVAGADLAFRLPPPPDPPEDRVVACLRPYTGKGRLVPSRFRDQRGGADEALVDALAMALDEVAATTGLAVHLVAFEAGRDDRFQDAVAERMTTPVTTVVPTLDTVLGEVARSRAVIATRYHGGVAAALAARPVVLLGYAPKVASLADDLGPGAALLPFRPDAMAGLAAAVEQALGHEAEQSVARDRLAERTTVHDEVLDRLITATSRK